MKRETPDIPLITIHDSILTTNGNEDIVRSVMQEEFKRLGVSSSLKEERYDKPELLSTLTTSNEVEPGGFPLAA